jgi:hypothetical protein
LPTVTTGNSGASLRPGMIESRYPEGPGTEQINDCSRMLLLLNTAEIFTGSRACNASGDLERNPRRTACYAPRRATGERVPRPYRSPISMQAVESTVLLLKLNQTFENCAVCHTFDARYVGLRTANRSLSAHSDCALCKEADASLRSGWIVPRPLSRCLLNEPQCFVPSQVGAVVIVAFPRGLQGRTLQWKCN